MSGDWIKMRCNLWDDPRIARLCDLTGAKEATVIGALYWLWATADQHTEDGILQGLSLQQVDRKTGVKGFAAGLVAVGWLVEHPEGVAVPHFDEHNGASAKKRIETARRVAKHRAGNTDEPPDDENGNAPSVTGALARESVTSALAREEKRREEENTLSSQQLLAPSAVPPKAPIYPDPFVGDGNLRALNCRSIVPLAASWELPEEWGIDAESLGWQPAEVLKESERFRQYWVSGKGVGKRRSVKGWRQSWSNWLAKAERFQR